MNKRLSTLTLGIILLFASDAVQAKGVSLGSQTIRKGLIQAILAKELCSCIYVQRLDIGHDELTEEQKVPYRFDECLERSSLPISPGVLKTLIRMNSVNSMFSAKSTLVGRLLALKVNSKDQKSIAVYLGKKRGCRLLTNEEIVSGQILL